MSLDSSYGNIGCEKLRGGIKIRNILTWGFIDSSYGNTGCEELRGGIQN